MAPRENLQFDYHIALMLEIRRAQALEHNMLVIAPLMQGEQ